jgi:predicted nucleotidyltransferase
MAEEEQMRLTEEQLRCIREVAAELLGADSRLWLFGSRADDSQKGGDIDLYVEVDRVLPNRVADAVRFAARLERRFDGLPVDVVVRDLASAAQPIHDIAKQTGVRL